MTVKTRSSAAWTGKSGQHPQAVDIAFIVVGALVAVGIGLGQGTMMRLENRQGGLWVQLPLTRLWLWAALVATRVVLGVIADASGAHVAASTAPILPILPILGLNRLAQAAVIASRAIKAGIPSAAEKDGSIFLGGIGTASRPSPTTGRQIAAALGGVLQERRVERHDDRRDRRRR